MVLVINQDLNFYQLQSFSNFTRDYGGRDHNSSWFDMQSEIMITKEFGSHPQWGVLYTILCNKVCQWIVVGLWFIWYSFTNNSDCQKTIEILLKLELNAHNLLWKATSVCIKLISYSLLNLSLKANFCKSFGLSHCIA